jgi:hypothetical protein
MDNLTVLEECYKKYIKDIGKWAPEGLIQVDLALLQKLNLLNYHRKDLHEPMLTRYFHVIESMEKITLVNDQFVVWIVPDKMNSQPITYTLIALNEDDHLKLEIAYAASGVYNTSKLVLRVLEKLLFEIQETEQLLEEYKKTS